jgi:hypothetical protein
MNFWLTTGKKKTVPKFSTKLACLLLGLVLVLSKNPRMYSALAIKKKNLSNNSMMLKNIYLFPSFHEIKTSNSATQHPQVPTKIPALKEAKEYKKNKRGSKRKGKKGKNTHHLCHESECRRLFGTLEQHSTTHRLLSINNPDRLLPGTSPKKNSKTKTECAPVFFTSHSFSSETFYIGGKLPQSHMLVKSMWNPLAAITRRNFLHWKKDCDALGFAI